MQSISILIATLVKTFVFFVRFCGKKRDLVILSHYFVFKNYTMKLIEYFYYAMQSIGLLFLLTCLRYLFGNTGIFTLERLIACIVGGVIVAGIGVIMDSFKTKKIKATKC